MCLYNSLTYRWLITLSSYKFCIFFTWWISYSSGCSNCNFGGEDNNHLSRYVSHHIYIYHHHHHHHVALVARISLTLSLHSSLSFIALGRSSGQHPVSSHSCWMYVRAGRPAFARPCVGVHKSTSLMSSSLLLQQCPACLVRLTWIVFVQLVSCGVLPPGLDCTQHSCVIAV